MNVNKLALKFNIYCYKKFKEFSLNVLPSKKKYPLLNKALLFSVSSYFESIFKPSNNSYPLFEPSFSEKKKIKGFIISSFSQNFFVALLAYVIKNIFLTINKSSMINVSYRICEIAPNSFKSSNLQIKISFLKKNFYYELNSKHYLQNLLRKLITSTLSPFTIIYFYILSIPLRLNIDYIQYLKDINPLILKILENSLRHDLLITKSFISSLNIKHFVHTGWLSIRGSLLFKALNLLEIDSKVYAHGHLSQPTLAHFYPIESSSIVVFTEEEANRLRALNNFFSGEEKKINFIISSSKKIIKRKKISKKKFSTVIIALSTPDCLSDSSIKLKYDNLLKSLLLMNIKVFFRPHHHASKYQKRLLSLNNTIQIYSKDINLLNKKNTLIIGSSTTLLLNAKLSGIESIELSDFAVNCSTLIKSVPCYTTSEFIKNYK